MKHIIVLFSSIFILLGCETQLEELENTNEQQNYSEKYTVLKGSSTKQGFYTKHNLQGDLMEEATYENGAMEGEQKLYNKGQLYSISRFKNGKLEGLYETFYSEGQLNVAGDYVNNIMHGKWKRYYPNGDLMEIVNFENNEENGPFVEFYPNGNVKAEGSYLNGDDEHGELFLYDINGILYRKMLCDKGICKTTWIKEGKEDWQGFRNN